MTITTGQSVSYDLTDYPTLNTYSDPLVTPNREIVGRERERDQVLAALSRPELSNVILLAPAGAGKTALVQSVMMTDTGRMYLEVDLARMIADLANPDQMAARIKKLFDEAEAFSKNEGAELVLFIDEFHQIVQLSAAAVEALKPILAASGTRGIMVIAATTYDEYNEHIAKNQPLVERLQVINLTPADKKTTINILHGMAERYGVIDQFYDDSLFEMIYDLTNRYIPRSAQPRKSILILDSMVGWHNYAHRKMDKQLIADVLSESANVNIIHRIDATKIKGELDSVVLSQQFATSVLARRLQICVADLHDKTKPQASFLFTGSTGVGKTEMTKQLSRLLFGDDQRRLIRFDMAEFAQATSMATFKSELGQQVRNLGHAILLFDEIEKAHPTVVRLLLGVLDDGRLTDDFGRQVSFLNTYIVLTTNAGSEIYETIAQYAEDDTGSGSQMGSFMKNIERSIKETAGDGFPPELLGRIDAIVPFQPLSRHTQERIILAKLKKLYVELRKKHGVEMVVDNRVVQYLVGDQINTDSNAGGAREAVRRLTDEVVAEIASFINAHPGVKHISVSVVGQMRSEDKTRLVSTARVVVGELVRD